MAKDTFRNQNSLDSLEDEIRALEEEIKGKSTEVTDPPEDVVETPAEEPKAEGTPTTPEEETYKKRYGDLRRFSQQKENELKREIEELKRSKEMATPEEVAPKTPEEVRAWMKKYPDVAGIVLSLVEQKSGSSKLDERLQAIEAKEQELTKKQAIAALRERHPDFDDITAPTSALHTWAADQPSFIQDILYEGSDPKDVSRILDLYKTENGIKTKRPQTEEQRAAKSVSGPSKTAPREDIKGKIFYESEVAEMSASEYEKREEEIFVAQREGRFVYDLKGGAY